MCKGFGNEFSPVVLPAVVKGQLGGTDDGAQRGVDAGTATHIHAAGFVATVAGVVARGEQADAVRVVLAKELSHDFALLATAIAVIDIVAVAVAHDNRFADAVGVVADSLERIGDAGCRHTVEAAQVEFGARCHAAIGGTVVVKGDRDVVAIDDDARPAGDGAGV